MREFRGIEFVDGDIKIYVREEGEGDDGWREAGVVRFGEVRQAGLVMERLQLTPPGGARSLELERLQAELSWPRRW